jgi:hypothetical protein
LTADILPFRTKCLTGFIPEASAGLKGAESEYYERLCGKPAGSFRGTYDNTPIFEVSDTAPSEYSAPLDDPA